MPRQRFTRKKHDERFPENAARYCLEAAGIAASDLDAVVFYEKIRDAVRRLRGLAPGGPADYEKLAPLTMGVFVLLSGVSAIVITADFVNPILLPG